MISYFFLFSLQVQLPLLYLYDRPKLRKQVIRVFLFCALKTKEKIATNIFFPFVDFQLVRIVLFLQLSNEGVHAQQSLLNRLVHKYLGHNKKKMVKFFYEQFIIF